MKPIKVFLGAGKTEVSSSTGVVDWAYTTGVTPYQRIFEVHADQADSLASAIGNETKLVFEGNDDEQSFTVEKLWLLGEVPPSLPYFRAFVVSDLRWMWARKYVARSYNVPRKSGTRRLIGGIPTQIDTGLDILKYIDWSLKDQREAWTGETMLRSVADAVIGENILKSKNTNEKVSYVFDTISGPLLNLPIQGFQLDDAGDAALAVAMRLLPGIDCYVDRKGVVHFFQSNNVERTTSELKSRTAREVEGTRHVVTSPMAPLRPRKTHVLFEREIELRFDSVTESDSATVSATDTRLMMENVLPVPDDTLSINGKTYTRGMWVTFDQAFSGWNATLNEGASPLSFAVVRRLWLKGDALEATYAQLGVLNPNADWAARVSTIRAHFRQTYRINPYWMRRIKALNAYRLGMYDPVTGVRSPAVAMMDYAEMCSWQGLSSQRDANEQYVFMNVDGYPGEDGNPDSDGKVAPAEVSIRDHDQGIIHIALRRDTVGTFQTMYPSKITDENGVDSSASLNTSRWRYVPMGMDMKVRGTFGFLELSPSHRVCVILSAVPGSPNTERRLHDITLIPSEISKNFSNSTRAASGGGGPEWYLRFGPNLTARIMWVQAQSELYPRIFGVQGTSGQGADGPPGVASADIPEGIIQNLDTLKEAATAEASSLWSTMLTKSEGTVRLHMEVRENDALFGNLTILSHRVEGGRLITEYTASPILRQIDLSAFLSEPARLAVLGVIPGVGGK